SNFLSIAYVAQDRQAPSTPPLDDEEETVQDINSPEKNAAPVLKNKKGASTLRTKSLNHVNYLVVSANMLEDYMMHLYGKLVHNLIIFVYLYIYMVHMVQTIYVCTT
ncbi:hypothetical protein ACJX0J_012442, partial [Zea mays]